MSEYKSAELQYGDIWDQLDDQLLIEYPFYINTYNVLPSDYHVTDFFNLSKSNADKTIKKWLKTPKDIADYLQSKIKPESLSPTNMELDPEHAFQIINV
jgi:hypothetical protein